MRDCHNVHEQLSAYLDGELSPTERGGMQTHLNTCAGCRAELERFEQLDAELGSMPFPDVPAHVWNSVAARIGGAQRRSRTLAFPLPMRITAAAAALLLVFGCGYLLGLERGRSEPKPPSQLPAGTRAISLPAVEQRMALEVIKATMLDGGAASSDRLDVLLGKILTEELRSDAGPVFDTQDAKKSNGA